MSMTNEIKAVGMQRFVIFSTLFITLGFFGLFAYTDGAYIFDLKFNAFAILSAVGVVANLVVLFFLRRYDHKNEENFWFAMMLVALIVFGLAEMLQRMSITTEAALFWGKVQAFGVGFEPIAVFMFALSYIGVKQRKMLLAPLLITGAAFVLFFHTKTQLVFKNFAADATPYLWGFNNDIGTGFILNALWVFMFAVLAIALLLRFRRRSSNVVLKEQAMVFIVAFAIPIVGALSTDILAPILGFRIPPMHVFFASITSVLILYGMHKYHAFKVSPARLSDEILETMHEAVLVVNQELGIEMMNTEAEKMFGKNIGTMAGAPIMSYFEDEHATRLAQGFEEIKADARIAAIDNLVIKTNDHAEPLYVKASINIVSEENGLTGYIIVLADVTELKRSYDLLEYQKNNVEHIVEERTAELREAQAKLIETDKLKTEFVILASHNLRTPVVILTGSIELVEKAEGLDDSQRQILKNAKQASKRLGELVEDLLTISSIEAGDKLSLNKISVIDVVNPLVEEAKQLAEVNDNTLMLTIAISNDVQVNGNLSRLQSAIRNVLDNAMKFTKNGKVNLAVSADETRVKIVVQDSGIGIKKDEIPKLFSKFHRGTDVLTYNYEGEGIGLYLTKLIIDEHDGEIHIESIEDKGTIVTITLPRSLAAR